MPFRKIIFQREDLYKKVWEKVLVQVAADYGLSDNGLKKICIKMNIPIPYTGYWAKLKHGKDVFQTPLPNLKPGDLETYKLEIEVKKKIELLERYDKLITMEEDLENKITVPHKIGRYHPIAKLTKEGILKDRVSIYDPFLRVHRGKVFNLTVSPNTVNRATLILNTFLVELEKRGFIIRTAHDETDWAETKIVFEDQFFEIELREIAKIESREKINSYTRQKEFEKIKIPTGMLKLELKHYWGSQTALVKDNKKLKVEDQLNHFIICLYRIINYEVKRNIEREKERKIEAVRQIEAQRLATERKREQDRTDNLLKLSDEWNRVKYISTFLDEMEVAMKEKNLLTEEKKDWLRWARNKMKSMNPINRVVL